MKRPYDEILNDCVENFGPVPRPHSLWTRYRYLRIPDPPWLRQHPHDKMALLFQNVQALFTHGVVVWGHVIQANMLLFEEGNDDCPGEVVFSFARSVQRNPINLQAVSSSLYALKGTNSDDPELDPIADYLAAETVRVFGLPVPPAISPATRCHISTTFFARKHLPDRRLCAMLLPMVVQRDEPHLALPLPERYWPDDFRDRWTQFS